MEPVSTSAHMETFGQGATHSRETMGNHIYLMELVSSVQSLLSVKRPVRKGPAMDWMILRMIRAAFKACPGQFAVLGIDLIPDKITVILFSCQACCTAAGKGI